jgi:GTPase
LSLSVVAIIGRQNVGKSTLLNRLAGKRLAIVEDYPGTTRDRVMTKVTWRGRSFNAVDTGGLEIRTGSSLAQAVREQAESAIESADLLVFLVNVRDGVVPVDMEIADMVRKGNKPLILVANKADGEKQEMGKVDFYELGLGEPMAISAHHGRGTADLLDEIVSRLPRTPSPAAETKAMKIAIVGRPNVGKSMLLNSLLGETRAIVSDIPGTTRDAIDTFIKYKGEDVLLIDTAGIRRRGKQEPGIEYYSVLRSLRAIDRADIALLVLDATEPLTAQDMHVAGYIQQAASGVVIVVNKWDLVTDRTASEYTAYIMEQIKFMPYAAVIYTSAKTGKGINKILPQAEIVYYQRQLRPPTAQVTDVIRGAAAAHTLIRSGKRLNVFYATQAEVSPPTFVIFVNNAKLVHFSYRRYLENKLRQAFGFVGTPIRLIFKSRSEE